MKVHRTQTNRTLAAANSTFLGNFDKRSQRQNPDKKGEKNDSREYTKHVLGLYMDNFLKQDNSKNYILFP